MWAKKNGMNMKLFLEDWFPADDGDGNVNILQTPHRASEMEVWGNYELTDGDMVHGWVANQRSSKG